MSQADEDCILCPFCENSSIEAASEQARIPAIVREYQDREFTVWRCGSCLSLHSKEHVDLAAYYAVYPLARQSEDYLTRHFCDTRLSALPQMGVKKSDSILDFGCGTGLFVRHLSKRGYTDVTGYDPYIDEFRIEAALARKYDVILAQDVIEHAEDPAAMFALMVGSLRTDGLLCLGTPCAERIKLKPYEPYAVSLHQPYHRHIFSTKALVGLARRHGLVESRIRGRHIGESAAPGANVLFLHEFIRHSGGVINAGFEPSRPGIFRRHPKLIWDAFFGFFFSRKSEMAVYFRLSSPGSGKA